VQCVCMHSNMLCVRAAVVNVIGMAKMTPPIKDLLPRLTPILKNRHEKVQVCVCVTVCAFLCVF